MANQKAFFDQLAIKWNIKTPQDWNKVTTDMVRKEGGSFIARHYNGSLTKGKIEILLEILTIVSGDRIY
jgi:hypothetical protein